ncbi:hypothetical protein Q9Q95_10165 [Sphingomonas sp. DG1-23]|uniref:DUF6916 family protein n=1 Tax=Sphingomonas sp. DG1-23 TaxID=3068316 RepID=UPI00273EB52F|nr:hypothetical protein [Sphingomonas sp. DG1-23]MDP5279284.1 hypothetical protein [Sphingomonas sp. DG1-23]
MSRSSRRAFVLGGGAAAIVAGPLAVAKLARAPLPSFKRQTAPSAPSEVAEWEKLAGASFLIGGEAGKAVARLVMVERPAIDPKRPAELARFQPFTAWFEMEARLAPAGQRTYSVAHPVKGAIDLFLGRGADKRGKAVLYALFN